MMAESSEDSLFSFEEELLYCIEKLEKTLTTKKLAPQAEKKSVLALATLINKKAPFVKKRQVMRTACGDYRKEMKEDLKKSKNELKNGYSIAKVEDFSNNCIFQKKKNHKEKPNEANAFCFNFSHTSEVELREV